MLWTGKIRVPAEIWTLAALLVLWQSAVSIFKVPEILVPPLNVVFHEIVSHPDFYFEQSLHTLSNTLAAFVLSVLFGVGLAIAIVHSRFLERTLYTVLVTLNNVPKIALAPLFVIWLGTGNASIRFCGSTKENPEVRISAFTRTFPSVLPLITMFPAVFVTSRRIGPLTSSVRLKLPLADDPTPHAPSAAARASNPKEAANLRSSFTVPPLFCRALVRVVLMRDTQE